jgi:hypothetical protein
VVARLANARKDEISPSFGRLGRRLLVSPWSEPVKRQLAGGDSGRRLADWADFQAARRELGAGASLFLYLDTRSLLTFGLNTLVFLAHVDMRYPPFDPMTVPDGSVIARHLSGTALAMKLTGDGQLVKVISPVGVLPGTGLFALGALYLEEASRELRVAAANKRIRTRMAAIERGVRAYQARHGKSPEKLSELYPDFVRDVQNFTLYERSWRPRRTDQARRYIDRMQPFLFMPAEFGKAGSPALAPNPARLSQPRYPVMMGEGKIVEMTRGELYSALRQAGYDRSGQPLPGRQPRPVPGVDMDEEDDPF